MNIIEWVLLIVAVCFFIFFVLVRLVAPFYGFRQYTPPTDLPPKVREAIAELENKSQDQMSYLQAVYEFVLDKNVCQWKHSRFQAAMKLPKIFKSDLEEIWETDGFIYCTAINFVSFALIANSKFFKMEDVKVKHVFLNFILHQYLQVKVGDKWIDFDPAGSGIRGKSLGAHASIFG